MSCLSERERAALEDVFLSISANQSPFMRCKSVYALCLPAVREKVKMVTGLIRSPKTLSSYVNGRVSFRLKRENLRKHLGLSRRQ